jgi:6-phosphogluconolactonase/glucosamine-6-phosphate isomerase/deaminase/pimeloyl-ACP methyl ester carboxylesterase
MMMNETESSRTSETQQEPEHPVTDLIFQTVYCKTKEQFAEAVGKDFIKHANSLAENDARFLVGLSHGQSPSLAYQYILEHYAEIKRPEIIRYTFINTPLPRQRNLSGITDAKVFLGKLMRRRLITKANILGTSLNRKDLKQFEIQFNAKLSEYLHKHRKDGLDYVFLATDPTGCVAGISRNSAAFQSDDFVTLVDDKEEKEVTITPHFLSLSKRIAFLATKSDKRRPLAWLFYPWGKRNESPSFLRYFENVEQRMTVYVDDDALTWPEVLIERKTPYGNSIIRVDTAKPYSPETQKNLPVVLMIHGFMGLNSFDGLLAAIPSHKYIAAAMHYGSVPSNMPVSEYSKHVVKNIDAVVSYFGDRGHPVYIFDHSMGNMYFLMIDRMFNELSGVKKYLIGRIGANPFFAEESKHALIGFLDNVILPSLSYLNDIASKSMLTSFRIVVPLDTKKGVRNRGIRLTEWLIKKESSMRDRIWKAVKQRILFLMSNMDSLPYLNRIPIEKALNKLPAKVFAIQVHSALEESKIFDQQTSLINMQRNNIPVMILKSEKDIVAKFVPRIYEGSHAEIIDVTNHHEKDLFREHLYHMVNPFNTSKIIDNFITRCEEKKVNQQR